MTHLLHRFLNRRQRAAAEAGPPGAQKNGKVGGANVAVTVQVRIV